MSLTAFGLACRQHRIRIGVVMADQSSATGVPLPIISGVERGTVNVTESYVADLANWMQLDRLETLQLRTLSHFKAKRSTTRNLARGTLDLKGILDRLAIDGAPAEQR